MSRRLYQIGLGAVVGALLAGGPAGCADDARSRVIVPRAPAPASTGADIEDVLDNMVRVYNGTNVRFIAGASGPSADVIGAIEVATAFQGAVGQGIPVGAAQLDIDVIGQAPNYGSHLIVIGNPGANMVADDLRDTYDPFVIPGPGVARVQSFSLPGSRDAILIVAREDLDRRRAARAVADELQRPGTYAGFNASVAEVYGTTLNDINVRAVR